MSLLARRLAALLFCSAEPVGKHDLAEALECEPAELAEALAEVGEHFAEGRLGVVLREVAGGFTFASDPDAVYEKVTAEMQDALDDLA